MPPEAPAAPPARPLHPRTISTDLAGICPRIVLALTGISILAAGANLSSIRGSPGGSASRAQRALSVVLIAVLLVAAGTTAFIVVNPQEGERFTEFYILGPTGKAADYPTEFMAGTPQTVIIGIGNHESGDVTYTVETFAVESRFNNATNEPTIVSATLIDRFVVTVPENRTVEQPYTFRIMNPDVDRLELLLFVEEPPEDVPAGNLMKAGYRSLHLLLRVH